MDERRTLYEIYVNNGTSERSVQIRCVSESHPEITEAYLFNNDIWRNGAWLEGDFWVFEINDCTYYVPAHYVSYRPLGSHGEFTRSSLLLDEKYKGLHTINYSETEDA